MEKLIYRSPKKHRIIAVKNLLIENDIPVSSVKLHIFFVWYLLGRGGAIREQRERRDDLNVPIEEFDDELNDAQTFEIYTAAEYEYAAARLIDALDEASFYGDCIFQSKSYDEAFDAYKLLIRNNIPCDEVAAGSLPDGNSEYLLYLSPEYREAALALIGEADAKEYVNQGPAEEEDYGSEFHGTRIFQYLLPLAIVLGILFFRINGQSVIEIIAKKIEEILHSLPFTT
jgi:hypothetical protein